MDIKAPASTVVSLAGVVRKHAAAHDQRVTSNLEAAPGDRIAPNDAQIRAARFIGAGQIKAVSARVVELAPALRAAQLDAFGKLLLHTIETAQLPPRTPLVDESHNFRLI